MYQKQTESELPPPACKFSLIKNQGWSYQEVWERFLGADLGELCLKTVEMIFPSEYQLVKIKFLTDAMCVRKGSWLACDLV